MGGVIRPGKILFEMEGVPLDIATEAMRLAAQKLPIPTKLVTREYGRSTGMRTRKNSAVDSTQLRDARANVPAAFQIRMGQMDDRQDPTIARKDGRGC